MSDDEMNRKMEFIVEQQAQFTADIQVLKERQVAFQAEQELLHRDVRTLHEDVTVLRETASTAIEIASRTADAVTTMATAQAETQRQLTRLARLFEAHIRDGHQHDTPTS